jgi:hypothetical protein
MANVFKPLAAKVHQPGGFALAKSETFSTDTVSRYCFHRADNLQ